MGGIFGKNKKKKNELSADLDEEEESNEEIKISPENAIAWEEHGMKDAMSFTDRKRLARYDALRREEQLLLQEQAQLERAKLAIKASRISKRSRASSGKSSKRFKKKKSKKSRLSARARLTESEVNSNKAPTKTSTRPNIKTSRQTTVSTLGSKISRIKTAPNSRSPSPSPTPVSRVPTIRITPSAEDITENQQNNNITSAVITPLKVSALTLDAPSDVLNSNVAAKKHPLKADDNNNNSAKKPIKMIRLRPNVSPQIIYIGQTEKNGSKKPSEKSLAVGLSPKVSSGGKKPKENVKRTPTIKSLFAKPATKESSLLGQSSLHSGSSAFKSLAQSYASKTKTKKKGKKKQQQKKKKRSKSAPAEDSSRPPNCKGCKKIRERSEYLRDPAVHARIVFEIKNGQILRNSLREWEEGQATNSRAHGHCRRKSKPRRRHSSCDRDPGPSCCYCPDFTQEFDNNNQIECCDQNEENEHDQCYAEPENDCPCTIEYCVPSCGTEEDNWDDELSSACSNSSDHIQKPIRKKSRKSRCKKRRRSRK